MAHTAPDASGVYGGSREVLAQSSPQCAGLCPVGNFCRGNTRFPQTCRPGTYCPQGSSSETPCPGGTASAQEGIGTSTDCQTCEAGYSCPPGSVTPTLCSPGSHAPSAGMSTCVGCPKGSFVSGRGATACVTCDAGYYCPDQSAIPLACPVRPHPQTCPRRRGCRMRQPWPLRAPERVYLQRGRRGHSQGRLASHTRRTAPLALSAAGARAAATRRPA